jgi:hypothetical protein
MQDAAKRKSLSPVSLAAVRVLLLLVVTLCLSQTRVWGFGITSQPASGQIAPVSASSTGENYDGFAYDASDSSVAAKEAGALRFTQTTASPWFHPEGNFAGQTISDVAAQLRAGTLRAADVPVTVVGDGLIVNTRSSLALRQAGIPQSQWSIIPGSAQDAAEIAARLSRNGLGPTGTDVIRITGQGSGASTLIGAGSIPPP